jgi:hypothetical protein
MALDEHGPLYEHDAYIDRLGGSLFNAGAFKERTNVSPVNEEVSFS